MARTQPISPFCGRSVARKVNGFLCNWLFSVKLHKNYHLFIHFLSFVFWTLFLTTFYIISIISDDNELCWILLSCSSDWTGV